MIDYRKVETWPLCNDIDVQMVDAESCLIRLGNHSVRISYEWARILTRAIDTERRKYECWRMGKWQD